MLKVVGIAREYVVERMIKVSCLEGKASFTLGYDNVNLAVWII